jgi:hypothetical protein
MYGGVRRECIHVRWCGDDVARPRAPRPRGATALAKALGATKLGGGGACLARGAHTHQSPEWG